MNIFFIEDNEITQFIFKQIMRKIDFDGEQNFFSNGLRAIDYIKKTNKVPDIIILDLNMPVMDGWEFLDEYQLLKDNFYKKSKVYIMSSSTHPQDKTKATLYDEVCGYLEKPINHTNIIEIIKSFHHENNNIEIKD